MYTTKNLHLSFTTNDIVKHIPYKFDCIAKHSDKNIFTKTINFNTHEIRYDISLPNSLLLNKDNKAQNFEFTAQDRTILHYFISMYQLQKRPNTLEIDMNQMLDYFRYKKSFIPLKSKELSDRLPILSKMKMAITVIKDELKQTIISDNIMNIIVNENNRYHKKRIIKVEFNNTFKKIIDGNDMNSKIIKMRNSKVYLMNTLDGRVQNLAMMLQNEGTFKNKYRSVNLDKLNKYGDNIDNAQDRNIYWNRAYKRLLKLCFDLNMPCPLYKKDKHSNMLIYQGMTEIINTPI